MDARGSWKVKINFGAGKQTWPGFFCVDAVQHPKAARPLDLVHAVTFEGEKLANPLPFPDECASELHSYHFLEHVYRWEAPSLVAEWHRLLKVGGILVLELPNIKLAAKNLLAGSTDQMSMWGLYGDPDWRDPYMCHRWGYTPETLTELLAGFGRMRFVPPRTHGARANRDMRCEAIRI